MAPILVAALLLIAIGAGAWVFLGSDNEQASKRAKEIVTGRGKPGKVRDAVEAAALKRKQTNADALKELGDRQKRSRKSMLSIKGQIAQAGLSISVTHFWIGAAVLCAVVTGGIYAMNAPLYAVLLVAFASFVGAPRWILGFLKDKRQKKFSMQMADAVDVIVRGVKSGLPLNQCLKIIATESAEPLRSEFANVVDGQTMGLPMDQNLQKLYERMPLAEVNFFNIVLTIQAKAGGNLSEALGNLSTVLRSRRLLKEKIKALSSEATASASIIGSLPLVVMGLVYLTRPSYIMMLFTTDPGRIILFFSALSMAGGIMVMRNMINFKF